jgi:DNA-directed RNA polymerase
MMLSALECQRAGLVYASVHDSYWTHACDVETMSSILREEFVRLHSQPLLKQLKTEFDARYSNHYVPTVIQIPPELSPDLSKTLVSLGLRKHSTNLVKIKAWVPVVFDNPPEKGGFDISLIKESKYFFH